MTLAVNTTAGLSIEDKINVPTLAKAAGLSSCPIEWVRQGKGGGLLAGQSGKPIAALEQERTVLPAPQWSESPGPSWVFHNDKYSVAVTPSTGAILIAPL